MKTQILSIVVPVVLTILFMTFVHFDSMREVKRMNKNKKREMERHLK